MLPFKGQVGLRQTSLNSVRLQNGPSRWFLNRLGWRRPNSGVYLARRAHTHQDADTSFQVCARALADPHPSDEHVDQPCQAVHGVVHKSDEPVLQNGRTGCDQLHPELQRPSPLALLVCRTGPQTVAADAVRVAYLALRQGRPPVARCVGSRCFLELQADVNLRWQSAARTRCSLHALCWPP